MEVLEVGERELGILRHIGRSLRFHWRSHLPVILGVMIATATLTGALLVGDSMRASLREAALARLGNVSHALGGRGFFRAELADLLNVDLQSSKSGGRAVPAILLRGSVTHAGTGSRVNRIDVLGVDDRLWAIAGDASSPPCSMPVGRFVILNAPLAGELGAKPGDEVLVRVARPSPVSMETLLGRRDDLSVAMRLTVHSVLAVEDVGGFSLEQRQALPQSVWIPLAVLQRALDLPGRVNAILIEAAPGPHVSLAGTVGFLKRALHQRLELADLGLRLRQDPERRIITLESDGFLIAPPVERAALAAGEALRVPATPVLTYLANAIGIVPEEESRPAVLPMVPYSTVTALDTAAVTLLGLRQLDGSPGSELREGDILLNEWAAGDLGAKTGDRIRLTYYVAEPFGRLEERDHTFLLRGVLAMDERAADPVFTPDYPGITDAKSLSVWDPPFPVDLTRVRDRDEEYWDRYRAAPKAFVALAQGRTLWTDRHESLGQSTSIRFVPPDGAELSAVAEAVERELRRNLEPAAVGVVFEPVRERALEASTGSADFGMLFLCFSFFLIVSAVLLVALLFRLATERRAGEVGLLLAVGFARPVVVRVFLVEGLVIATLGAAAGLVLSLAYAWLMLVGLESWWAIGSTSPFLRLHAPAATLAVGFGGSLVVALISIALAIRSLGHASVRSLLAGAVAIDSAVPPRRGKGLVAAAGLGAFGGAITLIGLSAGGILLPPAIAFFCGGAALVVAALCAFRAWLHRDRAAVIWRRGAAALLVLGARNALRHPGRSLLVAGILASATFVITALGAFRVDPEAPAGDRQAGTAGFTMMGESTIPLPYDLGTQTGREALGLNDTAGALLEGAAVLSFRLRSGDETSCRSLYRAAMPRIIGAPDAMLERGGFVFADRLPASAFVGAEAPDGAGPPVDANPWTLLKQTFPDGAIPVIGDEASVKWQLHSGLGEDWSITDESGNPVRLRFVALLAGSALQDELIVAEKSFVRLFPSLSGYSFFLIDVPESRAAEVGRTLERDLHSFAFDALPSIQRLAGYLAVQNTYLTTFQTLGGLGLVLGSVGLAVVLLRNIWERRGELALMRSLGFSSGMLARMVLAETALLVLVGLAAGALPALVAIAPHVASRPGDVPWAVMGLTLLGVFVAGMGAATLALASALRAPLLPALRNE
ncbi:MAG: FtsX-like permease family protein [Planctomycetota bacterium]